MGIAKEDDTKYELVETLNMVFKCRYCGTKLNTKANLSIGVLIIHDDKEKREFSPAETTKNKRRRAILGCIRQIREHHICNDPDIYFLEAYAVSPYSKRPIKIRWENL